MLGEPGVTSYDLNFSLFGIAIRIHPGFWAMGGFLGFSMGMRTPLFVLMFISAVFLSILIHEMGHALAFRQCGIRAYVVLYHFGGLAVPSAMESYFDHASGYTPRQKIFVTAAGPGLQIMAALLLVIGLRGIGKTDGFLTQFVGIPANYTADPVLTFQNIIKTPNLLDSYWALQNLPPSVRKEIASADQDGNELVTEAELLSFYRNDAGSQSMDRLLSVLKAKGQFYIDAGKIERFTGRQRELLIAADVRDDRMILISDMQEIHFQNVSIQNEALNKFVLSFVMVGTFWALLNLIPVYPLDGGQIARELFVLSGVRDPIPKSLMLSVAAGVGVGLWGVFGGQIFLAMMFFMMAWSSYQVLQKYQRGY